MAVLYYLAHGMLVARRRDVRDIRATVPEVFPLGLLLEGELARRGVLAQAANLGRVEVVEPVVVCVACDEFGERWSPALQGHIDEAASLLFQDLEVVVVVGRRLLEVHVEVQVIAVVVLRKLRHK